MLPTFVIGLREGLEAALIVGIIAAFLRKQGRRDRLRQVWLGVGTAILICLAVGVVLELFSRDLPQRQQEGLETVIGVLAVGIVTYMVIWMKEHSRGLKAQLETLAADALGSTGGRAGTAMVVMAFLAVLREGFETVVFLLAAFNENGSGVSAVAGAVLGIVVAVALGYGIYRGGVRINLSKFFRATGGVLVLVAGGLVVSALHTAHEAGWLNVGQHQMFDLSWLVQPGSVLASLLTGMLGVQPYPVLAEVVGWLLYVVPVGLFVVWRPGRAIPQRSLHWALGGGVVLGLGLATTLAWTAPTVAPRASATAAAGISAQVVGHQDDDLLVRTQARSPLQHRAGDTQVYAVRHSSSTTVDDVFARTYTATVPATSVGPDSLGTVALSRLNHGRLPIGVVATSRSVPVRHDASNVLSVTVEPRTDRVLDLRWLATDRIRAVGPSGQLIDVAKPYATASYQLPATATSAAAQAARADLARLDTRADRVAQARLTGILGGFCGLGLVLVLVVGRQHAPSATESADAPRARGKTAQYLG